MAEKIEISPAGEGAEIVNNFENAPTIFIDGIHGLATVNGVTKLNLFQIIQEIGPTGEPAGLKRVIVARLAMSPITLLSTVKWLSEIVKKAPEVEQVDGKT